MKVFLKFILSVLAGVLIGALVTAPWRIKNNKIVEKYCSTIYQYNVEDYKACKIKDRNEILEDLIKKNKASKEIVSLEVIK